MTTLRRRKPTLQSASATLTEEGLAYGLRALAAREADFAAILKTYGPPPLWGREPGFATLVRIILEQQVSLASAKAAYDRLQEAIPSVGPAEFLTLDDAELKAIGFSRQKTRYCRLLAQAIVNGQMDMAALGAMDETDARSAMKQIKGVGDWTTDIYLLMALRRPDIWPKGDLALAVAVQRLKGLKARPTPDELEALAERWRPWRAVAARLLWHYYLSTR